MADDQTLKNDQEEIKNEEDTGTKGGQTSSDISDVDFDSDMDLDTEDYEE